GAQNFSGLCPFHGEKTPSFSVHATRQFYYCFGCGGSGDVFSFVQKIENITFPEAVRAIAQKLNIPLPKASFSSPAEAREAKLRTALLEIHERASVFFQEQLRKPEGARAENAKSAIVSAAVMYSKFRNRVMFPIDSEAGRVIAFTGRTLSTEEKAGPKYLNSPETAIYSKSRVLFNLDHAREAIRKLDY